MKIVGFAAIPLTAMAIVLAPPSNALPCGPGGTHPVEPGGWIDEGSCNYPVPALTTTTKPPAPPQIPAWNPCYSTGLNAQGLPCNPAS